MDNERLDKLLEEIEEFDVDSYITEQLSRGPQNQDSFRGQYQRKCRWCPEPWHGLPITKKMRDMRQNPYAFDEFGQGIMDPNYRYDEDTSDWVCPGSDYHGPETVNRSWRRPRGAAPYQSHRSPPPDLKVWRFLPPYDNWGVSLETVSARSNLTGEEWNHACQATFIPRDPVPVPEEMLLSRSHPWWRDVMTFTQQGQGHPIIARMKRIVFDYEDVRLHFNDAGAMRRGENPDWVEFITAYDFTRHPWCVEHFQSRNLTEEERRRGFPEAEQVQPYQVIDEVYEFDLEGFNRDIEELRAREAAENWSATEAALQEVRRQAVSQEGGEVPAPPEDGMEEGPCG